MDPYKEHYNQKEQKKTKKHQGGYGGVCHCTYVAFGQAKGEHAGCRCSSGDDKKWIHTEELNKNKQKTLEFQGREKCTYI